jgi:hypothetical protein
MVDQTHESDEVLGIAKKIVEKAVFGGVLFALVVFGMFKGLLG